MKKNLRYLLIMLAVLVVTGGGAAALLLTQPAETEEDSSSSSSTAAESIMDAEQTDVASVDVVNPDASFTIVPLEDTASSSSSSDSDSSSGSTTVNFTVEGYEGYDLDESQVSTSVRSILILDASRNLGQQEDLEQFGLTGGSATTVTIHFKDGSGQELVLGNEAGETVGRYVLKDGVVYIASSVSSLLLGSPLEYMSTEIYSVPDRVENEGTSDAATLDDLLYFVEISGAHYEEPIVIEYDDRKTSGYVITSPLQAESGSTAFTDLRTALKSLTAGDVAAVGRSEEQLAEFGLTEPDAQVTFNMNGETHTIAVSAAGEDGNRYLIADSKDAIYQIASEDVSTWAEADLMDLRMNYIWLPNINDVSRLTLALEGDQLYAYDVTRQVNEESSTETTTSYDLTIANAGGETVDYENYQDFYQMVLSLSVLSMEEGEYGETPALTVTYDYFSGDTADTVAFYPVEGKERYAAFLNGTFSGLVRKTDVDGVISQISSLDSNEAIES